MAGRGPAPDPDRVRRGKPTRDWKPSPDGGWQGDLPEPPAGISPAAVAVWEGWFRAWWAAEWTSDDVPVLRFVIRLWDRVSRGDVKRAAELRQWLDSYGITPKGRQDRRWSRPKPSPWQRAGGDLPRPASRDRFAILRGEQPRPSAGERFTRMQQAGGIDKSRYTLIDRPDPRLTDRV